MITHDSWQQIKKIFQSAQGLTAADRVDYLNKACGDDASLREEVEALLTADESNDDFLIAPAYEFAAGLLAEDSEFAAGQKIGPYTILCPLGSGGMGQIYLAEDPRLRRKIAVKLIAEQFASDARRVRRFEQEALAASALNHPNICVIHAVGTTDNGRHFIAMEYIQGVTLRDQMSRGPLPIPKALNIATQVSAALASAHALGIVHRDIKPENIMLRPDGYVKVLDFGLAKLTEVIPGPKELSTNLLTETGTLMGTVKYMSPEQLRETKVDERSDIWSLGVVLHEMLTGKTPFDKPTSNDTIATILASQPVQIHVSREIPARLREIIAKSLEKDSSLRYQTVMKFAADLRQVQIRLQRDVGSKVDSPLDLRDEPTGLFTRIKSQAILTTEFLFSEIRSHKRAAIFAGATAVLALLLFLPSVARFVNNLINRPAIQSKMTQVTNAGSSVCSAVSRDGKWVAHAEERSGKQRLVLTNLETATSSDIVAASEVQYIGVSFTRDGNYLYITRLEAGVGILYRLALPGGLPVKIKDQVDSQVSLSPQEDRFAFVRVDKTTTSYSLVISTAEGSSEQVLRTRNKGDAFSIYGLAWSPDTNLIVCPVSSWNNGYKVNLVAIDVRNGQEKLISDEPWFAILQIAWRDDMSGLVMSARDQATSPVRLWGISYPSGAVQPITTDLAEYRGVSFAGQDLVTVRSEWSWELTVANTDKNFEQPSTIASGVGLNYGVTWAGNNRIVFSAMAQDSLNISRIDVDGSNQVQLTLKTKDNYFPAATSDGRIVVFSSNRSGKYNIWRMNVQDGSDPKQLTFTDGDFYPAVSPDNQWVAYDNQQSMQKSVWRIPLEGGNATKVVDRYRMPAISPDNQFIVARYDLYSGTNDIAILSAANGEILKRISIPNLDWQRVQWLSQNTLSYIDRVNGYPNIFSYDIVSGEKKQLTNFNRNQIFSYAWSPDHKLLACQLGSKTSNVVKIKSEK
jgi:eukaryotic-like serine/threonine-protein kinase